MADTQTDYPYVLVVVHALTVEKKAYVRGDVIDDPEIIAQIMDTHRESFVVKRAK